MPDWQLWSLEPLFNHRECTAWGMAKLPSPARSTAPSVPRGGKHSGVSFPTGFYSAFKHSGQAATAFMGTHKASPHGQTTGECQSAFWESPSLLLSFKSFFSRQRSLEKSGLFHIMTWPLFLLTFLLTSISRSMPAWSFGFLIFPNSVLLAEKNANKHVSDILDKKID